MAITFDRAKLILSNNSTFVGSVDVILNDSQCFIVAPEDPSPADGKTLLPAGQNSRPFYIVENTCASPPHKPAKRVAKLAMDNNAIHDWHDYFDAECPIILHMQLDDGTPVPLTVDLFCEEHSTQHMQQSQLKSFARVVAFAVNAVVGFVIAVFTLQLFRRSKEIEKVAEPARSSAH